MKQYIKIVLTPAVASATLLLAGCGGNDGAAISTDTRQNTAQQACDALKGKAISGATIASASLVPAASPTPAYCKITAKIDPSLNFELRLPDSWNGKLYYGGGGGYNGATPDASGFNLGALLQGYATVNSDSGHQGSPLDASFAMNDPNAAQLFGSLSIPTVMSSALDMVKTAYGAAPKHSYF